MGEVKTTAHWKGRRFREISLFRTAAPQVVTRRAGLGDTLGPALREEGMTTSVIDCR
ncbi:hypothetical protein [Salinispora cortesiana]|uniref:hypothetical protein n=1 Tax=Salinispora cortesiana TaxID=1305843 RepID=UPI00165F9FC8|nr:hypothetical protein [Salinispora cortesiana]